MHHAVIILVALHTILCGTIKLEPVSHCQIGGYNHLQESNSHSHLANLNNLNYWAGRQLGDWRLVTGYCKNRQNQNKYMPNTETAQ